MNSELIISITKATYISDYILKITFSDGKHQDVDFYPFLNSSKHPENKKYLDKDIFKSFIVEDGELMWGDFDLLFPIWDLYNNHLFKNKEQEIAS